MTDSLCLVPATVELTPLDGKRARLSVLWTNGQRGKWDGPQADVRECQTQLLQAMAAQSPIDVTKFPELKIGSGFEYDW